VSESIEQLVVRTARENLPWGYGWIQGALDNLGYFLRRSTIARILKAHGIEPAPDARWMTPGGAESEGCVRRVPTNQEISDSRSQPLFTKEFAAILKAAGVKTIKLPPRSPDLNPHAERFVWSIKSECLSKMILFSDRQLRRAIEHFTAHYHEERNHQGLDNKLIQSGESVGQAEGDIRCRERLGGLLRYYHRAA